MSMFTRGQRRWYAAAFVVLALCLVAVFAPSVEASDRQLSGSSAADLLRFGQDVGIDFAAANQIFRDDLTVESGQEMDGDVIVYDGDVKVESGGAIHGNLVVYSGDIEIESGATVDGDLSAFSGDISVSGTVDGSIASWSGDVYLATSAYVGGDVSVLSGEIDQEQGAFVGGNLVEGPSFKFPMLGAGALSLRIAPGGDEAGAAIQMQSTQPTFWQRLGAFVIRVVLALLATVVVALLAAGLIAIRPTFVESVKTTMVEQTALSFAVGLVVNLVLMFLTGILLITICLAPFALAPILVLMALNLAGWTALSKEIGQRLVNYSHAPIQPVVATTLGALVVTGLPSVLWAFGGCFRFMSFVTVLLVASAGAGAVLLPWLNRQRMMGNGKADVASGAGVVQTATQAPTTEVMASTYMAAAPAPAVAPAADLPVASTPQAEELPSAPVVSPGGEADFTLIRGIGPAFGRRLKAANVRTYAALASLSAEELADILGWSVERVVREDLLVQAKRLAQAEV